MTQIKIEVPANDHIALSAMADALQRIAAERAPSVTVGDAQVEQRDEFDDSLLNAIDKDLSTLTNKVDTLVKQCEEFKTPKGDDFVEPVDVEIARMDVEFEEAVESINDIEPTPTEQDNTLDADGLPWDKRIHSRGKTRLSDDTWRLARKPNDKTDEEWTAYVESVKAELKAVQDIPSVEPEKLNDIDVAISDEKLEEGSVLDVAKKTLEASLDEQVVADLTPPVIDEPAIQFEGVTPNGDVAIEPPVTTTGAPVAPVTPPTSLTPPVVEAPSDQPSVTTFQELMLYITGNAKKRGADNDMIKSTLAEVDPALTAIPLIATRADLIPKFVTALEAKLS